MQYIFSSALLNAQNKLVITVNNTVTSIRKQPCLVYDLKFQREFLHRIEIR